MNVTRFIALKSILRQQIPISHRGLLISCDVKNFYTIQECGDGQKRIRFASTCAVNDIPKEKPWFRTVLEKLPFLNISKTRIRASAYLLYEEIVDNISYINFIEKFDLPDTFYTWFVITELHIWMLSVRAMAEGDSGRHLRNCLAEALWADVALRAKKLGPVTGMRDQISQLSEQLQAALISYDEGLQSSDTVLAGALWRRFYQSEFVDLVHLEKLVKYVRKQITMLDNTPSDNIFIKHRIGWESLDK